MMHGPINIRFNKFLSGKVLYLCTQFTHQQMHYLLT